MTTAVSKYIEENEASVIFNTAVILISPEYPFSATDTLSCIMHEEIGPVLGPDLGLSNESLPNLTFSNPLSLDCRSFLSMGLVLAVMTSCTLLCSLWTPSSTPLWILCTSLIKKTPTPPSAHSSLWLIQTCRTTKAELTLPCFSTKEANQKCSTSNKNNNSENQKFYLAKI